MLIIVDVLSASPYTFSKRNYKQDILSIVYKYLFRNALFCELSKKAFAGIVSQLDQIFRHSSAFYLKNTIKV